MKLRGIALQFRVLRVNVARMKFDWFIWFMHIYNVNKRMYSIVEPWVREKACELKPMVCNDESKHAFVRLLSLLVLVLGPLGALSSA